MGGEFTGILGAGTGVRALDFLAMGREDWEGKGVTGVEGCEQRNNN